MRGGVLEVLPLSAQEAGGSSLTKRYKDVPPQLAGAALMYLAKREKIDTIFTLDRGDFSMYRTSRKHPFRIVADIEFMISTTEVGVQELR